MFETILAGLSPFILNAVVGITKWTGGVRSTGGKRFLLAVFAIIGVFAFHVLTGQPVDVNLVSGLVKAAIEALVAFLAAHGSYHLFWASAPVPADVTDMTSRYVVWSSGPTLKRFKMRYKAPLGPSRGRDHTPWLKPSRA